MFYLRNVHSSRLSGLLKSEPICSPSQHSIHFLYRSLKNISLKLVFFSSSVGFRGKLNFPSPNSSTVFLSKGQHCGYLYFFRKLSILRTSRVILRCMGSIGCHYNRLRVHANVLNVILVCTIHALQLHPQSCAYYM